MVQLGSNRIRDRTFDPTTLALVFEKRCQTRCHRVLPRWHRVLSCNVFHRNLASFSVIYLSSALETRNLAQIPMKHVLESLKKRATSTPRKRERRNETRWYRVRPDGIGSPDAIGPIPMPLCRKRPRGIGWGDSICFSNTTSHFQAASSRSRRSALTSSCGLCGLRERSSRPPICWLR